MRKENTMDELISRQVLLDKFEKWQKTEDYSNDEWNLLVDVLSVIKSMPPAPQLSTNLAEVGTDCISRQQAIDALRKLREEDIEDYGCEIPEGFNQDHLDRATFAIKQLPPANNSEIPNSSDMISRAKAIDGKICIQRSNGVEIYDDYAVPVEYLEQLPSAQPERRCVNCGRTVNNGGWYEDGRTRCPIEEHYALPKDGYCHLWEKRKDWEDDYVKRAEEGEK